LPGLVVDRYADYLVLQLFSAGMERLREWIAVELEDLVAPRGIVERSDSPLRGLEGLPPRRGLLRGTEPGKVTLEEDGVRMDVDLLAGQKTGAFLDQRENHRLVRRYARGARVLDAFCHDGAFGLHAAAGGAEEIWSMDASAEALERARHNADAGGVGERFQFLQGDGLEVMRGLRAERGQFDLVILDPPSYTRSRKHVPQARRAYRELHRTALALLRPGGFLATSSCSHHIREDTFFETVLRAAHESGRRLRWVARGMQSPDHPVLPDVPETGYLKFGLFQALDAG
jgi:23S rRNA (cytosine1962-C5)-methyltransferase